ncbi:OmpA family protein [uncultured Winogradskyella sp.]|uniref:OmpA family protein n=1 Tax=uncultured Winogradskyella sp. TaxID=395353 RepID=UPI002631406A|nr:OmpA family protein [uncultured Winogradskyella sp.]
MKYSTISKQILITFCLILFATPKLEAQTKKIKRPKSRVGVTSVDNFVRESFDLYDKVYKYDGYAASGTPLEDEDIDVLEEALDEMSALSESAPDILNDLDGVGMLKQGKATLQMNKAKKALKYSIKTAKELLLGQRERESKEEEGNTEPEDKSDEKSESDSKDGNNSNNDKVEEEASNVSDNLEVYSKFDFVPGDKQIYFDDFSQDFIGDFPSKWNTNGTGEVVKVNNVEGKWFELKGGYGIKFIPLLPNVLPEEYTIEFDILAVVDKKTSSTARLNITLDDNNEFKDGANRATAEIPLGQYGAFDIRISNRINNATKINSALNTDLRSAILNKPHISIAVNKRRYRLWINQKKYVDIPQFVAPNKVLSTIKFNLLGMRDGEDRLFISNLKVAEGGVDLRRKLMAEGRISTNGILFDSGSANIQPQSLGIVRQISQVLMQDDSIKLNIIGHTDSDGSDDANLKLSKDRAMAVKNALVNIYKISEDRLTTDGKGETQPIDDNSTSDGKAQNRRVEFVKI